MTMIKMKRVLLFTSFCMMILLSCSSDDDGISSKIVGQWLCTSGTTTVYDLKTGEVNEYPYSTLYSEGASFYFYDDGTCYYQYKGVRIDCTYKLRGDKIDIIDNSSITTNDIEFTNGKMILSGESTDTGVMMRRTVRVSVFDKK